MLLLACTPVLLERGCIAINIKMESIRKLSNFNFQWTKILYQNNLKHIAFFFTFFESYGCNLLSIIFPDGFRLNLYFGQFDFSTLF